MNLKVNVKVDVNRKIVVNGKEYGSVEELPEEFRGVYEKAVASARGGPGVSRTIAINGRVYAGPEEMEPDVRAIYEKALENARAAGMPADPPPAPPAAIPAPTGFDPAIPRRTIAIAVAVIAAILIWLLTR